MKPKRYTLNITGATEEDAKIIEHLQGVANVSAYLKTLVQADMKSVDTLEQRIQALEEYVNKQKKLEDDNLFYF